MDKVIKNAVTSVFEGRVVKLFLEDVTLPNGSRTRYEVVHHAGAAAVLPLHEDGSVTLVHQYRHAIGGYLYEIPAGLLEDGESPAICAGRELEEEAGLIAAHVEPLTRFHPAPGFSDELVHLFLATGLTPCPQRLEDDEVLTVVRMPLAEALTKLAAGEMSDAKTQIALLMVAARQQAN
jgi:ADP-ribose pyrophosphatase